MEKLVKQRELALLLQMEHAWAPLLAIYEIKTGRLKDVYKYMVMNGWYAPLETVRKRLDNFVAIKLLKTEEKDGKVYFRLTDFGRSIAEELGVFLTRLSKRRPGS
jgi:hypothetical protein